ncbi:MAG TPA: PfkB family carbohydrate kinase [Ktedonobacterales bacterium]|nr:PfkB family carbohydrate kinase [Ktedonobacterales bacterium]
MAILVVGSIGIDLVETPFGRAEDILGGTSSHFCAAASFYDTVQIIGVVGTDFPTEYLDYFRSRGADIDGIQMVEGKTFRWGGRYHLDMNTRDTLYTELGVFADFHPKVPEHYASAPIVFLANIHPSLQNEVLEQATGARLTVLDSMNLWISTTRQELAHIISKVDLVIMNEEEARQYANVPGLVTAARKILAEGPRMVVIKQGSYGALLFSNDGSFFAAPAYPLEEVRDPTGAGDAFAGGFIGYLARAYQQHGTFTTTDFKRALIHGNIMGSFHCEDFGLNRLKALTPDDINTRYHEFLNFTHFDPDWANGTR